MDGRIDREMDGWMGAQIRERQAGINRRQIDEWTNREMSK